MHALAESCAEPQANVLNANGYVAAAVFVFPGPAMS